MWRIIIQLRSPGIHFSGSGRHGLSSSKSKNLPLFRETGRIGVSIWLRVCYSSPVAGAVSRWLLGPRPFADNLGRGFRHSMPRPHHTPAARRASTGAALSAELRRLGVSTLPGPPGRHGPRGSRNAPAHRPRSEWTSDSCRPGRRTGFLSAHQGRSG